MNYDTSGLYRQPTPERNWILPSTHGLDRQQALRQPNGRAEETPGRYLEPLAKKLLETYQLDVPRSCWADTADQAIRFARIIGYPVVAKVVSTAVWCKTARGGVETEIDGDGALRSAFDRLSRFPRFYGILVEEQIKGGLELNVAMVRLDGGGAPEIFIERRAGYSGPPRCQSFRFAEGDTDRVRAALEALGIVSKARTKNGRILNEAEFSRMLTGITRIVVDSRTGVKAVSLHPVVCTPSRCVVLDARIRLGGPSESYRNGIHPAFSDSRRSPRVPSLATAKWSG